MGKTKVKNDKNPLFTILSGILAYKKQQENKKAILQGENCLYKSKVKLVS